MQIVSIKGNQKIFILFKTKIYTNLKNQTLLSIIDIFYTNQTIMLKIYIATQVPNGPIYVSRRNLIPVSKLELQQKYTFKKESW